MALRSRTRGRLQEAPPPLLLTLKISNGLSRSDTHLRNSVPTLTNSPQQHNQALNDHSLTLASSET